MLNTVRDLCRTDSARYGGTDGKLIGSLGRYENLTPFEVWLCENVSDLADETSGDVEWSEWFARIGRRMVEVSSVGFWYVTRYATEAKAVAAYETLDEAYGYWLGEDD
jgi:hypothetical protein